MAAPEWLTLCWNGQPLGRITEIQVFDWPWVCGRFAAGDWPTDLRFVVECEARHNSEDDADSDGPPYVEGWGEGWSVVHPEGRVEEIGLPRVDFDGCSIEWR